MASGVQGSRSPALLLLVPVPGPTGSVLPPPARPHSAAAAQLVSSRRAATIHSVRTQTSLVSP